MTATRTHPTIVWTVVTVALAMLAVLAAPPPAEAAAPLQKKLVIPNLMWRADVIIAEDRIPMNKGTTCAPDLDGLTTMQKRRVCKAKAMGVWSGARFHPNSYVDRGQLARYYLMIQRYLNREMRHTMSQTFTTSQSILGSCGASYDDCGRADGTRERIGIAFLTYWGMDDGYSARRQYDPNVRIGKNGNARKAWDHREWWSTVLD